MSLTLDKNSCRADKGWGGAEGGMDIKVMTPKHEN